MNHSRQCASAIRLNFSGSLVFTYSLHTGEVGKLSIVEDGPYHLRDCTHPEYFEEIIKVWFSSLMIVHKHSTNRITKPLLQEEDSLHIKCVSMHAVAQVESPYLNWERKYHAQNVSPFSFQHREQVSIYYRQGAVRGRLRIDVKDSQIHTEHVSALQVLDILCKGLKSLPESATFEVVQEYSDEFTNESLYLDRYYSLIFEGITSEMIRDRQEYFLAYHIPHLDEIRYVAYNESPSLSRIDEVIVVIKASMLLKLIDKAHLPSLIFQPLTGTTMQWTKLPVESLWRLNKDSAKLSETLERVMQYTRYLSPI